MKERVSAHKQLAGGVEFVQVGLPSLLTLSSLPRLQWLGDLQGWEGLMLDSTATRVIRGLVRRGWKEQMYENANSWDQE